MFRRQSSIAIRVTILSVLLLLLVYCGKGLNNGSSGNPGSGGGGDSLGVSPFSFSFHGGLNRTITASQLASDDKLHALGSFTRFRTDSVLRLVRFLSSGAVDPTFVSRFNSGATTTMILPSTPPGSVLFGGLISNYDGVVGLRSLVRTLSNGAFDSSFTDATFRLGDIPTTLAESADGTGDIYVAGFLASYGGVSVDDVMRINSDGSLDTNFNTGTGLVGSNLPKVLVLRDGSNDIYVFGTFSSYNGTAVDGLFRVNSNGSLDSAFSTGAGVEGSVSVVIEANDGSDDIYIAGGFTSYDGANSSRIARVNSDGSRDGSFAIGTGFNGNILTGALATDGDLYVTGSFTSYNGSSAPGILRLNTDGSIDTNYNVGSGTQLVNHIQNFQRWEQHTLPLRKRSPI